MRGAVGACTWALPVRAQAGRTGLLEGSVRQGRGSCVVGDGRWGGGGGFAEDGVDEAGGFGAAEAAGLLDGFVDGGGGGDAVEEAQLIEADGEDLLHERVDTAQLAAGVVLDQVAQEQV